VVAVYSEVQFRQQATDAAGAQARVLANTSTAALAFGDHAALQEYVNALKANQDADAVGVYDNQGRLAAGFSRSFLARRLDNTVQAAAAPDRVIVTVPIFQKGARLGTVYMRDLTEPLDRRLSRYAGAALLTMMAALLFGIMLFNARALRRANRALITQMAERAKAEAALRQSQKMEAVGRLTGGIAHDFNNMLAVVIGSLDLLIRRHLAAEPKGERLANNALDGAKRASALTQRLLAFSRLQPLKPTSIDVARSVNDMADLLRRTLGETIVVEVAPAHGLWRAHIDIAQLESAIVNLAINARDAMPDGGKLTIETSNVYLDRGSAGDPDVTPGQYVVLAMCDTGSGMPPDVAEQAFEPFFTTKPTGMGTGLGLSQVHGFVRQSGGQVRIHSEVGKGTTVRLYLPRSTAVPEPARVAPAKPVRGPKRHLTVLLVEDEEGVRDFAAEALVELGYDVLATEGARPALELMDARHDIAVLLTDVVMPETNGRVLAEEALKRLPFLKVVYMTGYTRDVIVHNGVLDADTHLINKPFTVAQLGAEIEAALGEGPRPNA
jgi:signal transduction histidine kinase